MRSDLDQLSRPGEQVDPQIGPTPAAASIPYPLAAPTADSFAQRTLWHDAWERLAHNRIALAGGFVILMLTVVAVAARP